MAKKVKGISAETQQAIKAAVDAGLKAGIIHAEAAAKEAGACPGEQSKTL